MKLIILIIALGLYGCGHHHHHGHSHDHDHDHHDHGNEYAPYSKQEFVNTQKNIRLDLEDMSSEIEDLESVSKWLKSELKMHKKEVLSLIEKIKIAQSKLDRSDLPSLEKKQAKLSLHRSYRELLEKKAHFSTDFKAVEKVVENLEKLKEHHDHHGHDH